jgi:hypothetical protein
MLARIALAVAWWLAATGCASLSPARNAGLLTISIEGEAHEIQTFKPVRPKPAACVRARPFMIIRAADVAVLRPPGPYRLHVTGGAARNYVVIARGYKGDRAFGDVLTLPAHLDRISGGPYSMDDRWEWHFYAIAGDAALSSDCRAIR